MTSSALQSWFNRKLHARRLRLCEERLITERYSKIYGPGADFGVVTLAAHAADEFTFSSCAVWPAEDNFEDAVLDGVLDALFCARYDAIVSGVAITLAAIEWCDVDSTRVGYYHAAKTATISIIQRNTMLADA